MARKSKKSSQPGRVESRKPAASVKTASPARALQRRQVLKGVVVGSGVVASAIAFPKEWTKPVVQSIVASAHAQVSPPQAPNPLFVPVPLGPVFEPLAPQGPPTNPLFVPVPILN